MSTEKESLNKITPEFRVSYPNVFEPKENTLSKKLEYSVVALFKPGEKLEDLRKAVTAACKKKWGEDPKRWPKKLMSPFRDQGEREKETDDGMVMPDGYVTGATFCNLRSTRQPGIIDQKKKPITDPTKFYAGCWARADVFVNAWEYREKNVLIKAGVSLMLNNLQLVRDDDAFSGKRKAESAFEAIDMPEDSETASEDFDPFAAE